MGKSRHGGTVSTDLARWIDRLWIGDCLSGLESMPAGSVNLAFADPPFNIGFEYDTYHDHRSDEEYLEWCHSWMRQVHRLLKPNGTLWVAMGDEYVAELKVLLTHELGFHLRSWVVWYYTFGQNCRRNFSRSHTHLLYLVKDPQKFTFNHGDPRLRVPSARQRIYHDSRGNPSGRLPDNTWILRPQEAPGSFGADEDTWHVPRVNGTFRERQGFHGCQMPEQVLGRIIRACSHQADVVLDPFVGSGTTAVVAKKLKRHFVGFEESTEYANRACERVREVHPGDPLAGTDVSVATSKGAGDDDRQSKLF
ncbi:MAG: site-specific DNA-methyltransferase [Planctomycetaceae bacterium]|nr:site-specific DNA-methyltransferase [Planctomycetaceae bacterium]